MTTFHPIQDRVLVKPEDAETETPGGILIPENAQKTPARGLVIAVGRGRVTDGGRVLEPHVKTGDRVVYGRYAGQEVRIDGEDHVVLREEEILGVLE